MAAPRDKCDDQLCDYGKSKSVSCFSCHWLVVYECSKVIEVRIEVRID